MAFTANVIGRVRKSGVDTQGAFFDPSLCTLTDLAATSGTGTAPVVSSASYNFVAGDVGAYVFVKSGTNWTPGWYLIASVAANAATLTATIGSARLYTTLLNTFNAAAGCATTASPTGGTWSVDYSQQDAAIGATSDYTSTASTTVTSATAGFTVAMIGNAFRLSSGSGATVGYYFITAVASATSLTCDRASGTYTAGVGKVGGGAVTWQRLATTGSAAGDKVVPGNFVFIQGGGTDSPSAVDYTATTGFTSPPDGNSTVGRVRIIGENGRPRLQSDGLMFYQMSNCWFENLYLTCSSNSNGTLGIIGGSAGTNNVVTNVVINTNNKTATIGIVCDGAGWQVTDCEIFGNTSSPSFSSGCYGIQLTSYAVVSGNYIHHTRDSAINQSSVSTGGPIEHNILYACQGDTISLQSTLVPTSLIGNIIDGGGAHGITIATTACLMILNAHNNVISNHVTAGKFGFNMTAGSATLNDLTKGFCDYNNIFNCGAGGTSLYNGISAGIHDLNVDPQYTSAGTNWAPSGTNLKAKGFPSAIRKTSTTEYIDIGLQHQDAGGGASTSILIF